MRRRVRLCYIWSRSTACSRQIRARAHVEKAAIGTLRRMGMRVPGRCTRSGPAWRGQPGVSAPVRGGNQPGPMLPLLPWSNVGTGTGPLARIFPGNPGAHGGRGRRARHTAGPHRSSAIPSVSPPHGAGTAASGRTMYRTGGRRRVSGAAFVGVRLGCNPGGVPHVYHCAGMAGATKTPSGTYYAHLCPKRW